MIRQTIVVTALFCAAIPVMADPPEMTVLPVTNAVSSSHGTHGPKHHHYAAQAVDGDLSTSWSSQSLAVSNEWIRVSLVEPSEIDAIRVVNGWVPKGAPHWYKANHRAKGITVQCDKRTSTSLLVKDTHEPQTFLIDTTGIVSNVTLTIVSVYTNTFGGDRPSITVSEIELLKKKDAPTRQSTRTKK